MVSSKKTFETKSTFMKKFAKLSPSQLYKWLHHKSEDIKNLRTELRKREKQTTYFANSIVEQMVETEEHLSYILIEDYGRIIASTPTFRKIFYYDNPDKPIKGRPCYSALKIPSDAPDYIHNLEEVLKKPERLEKQTTIYNGKGEEVIIRFTKYEPTTVAIGYKNFSFTRVDIYEIGLVEKIGDDIVRTFHLFNGETNILSEFIIKNINEKRVKDSEKEKENIMSGNYKKKIRIKPVSSVAWKDKTKKEKRKAAKERLNQREKKKK